jgi:hypothetical protein
LAKPRLEVADVFREYGEDYRNKYGPCTSPEQWRVMRAIEICRTSSLGGHIDECDACGHQAISYNSCRNRHCPKCQSLAKAEWLEARKAEVLPVEYYHVVFTLPEQLRPLALQNKNVMYNILFRAVSKTMLTIASDSKHLGADIGFTAILHTWGQTLMDHPHVHCVVPGGGLSHDEQRWVSCRKGFFLPKAVLSRLFRRLFLQALKRAFDQGELEFHNDLGLLSDAASFDKLVRACRRKEWVVYVKPPFGGPEKVLDYLGRYTHRIAISNHRLLEIKEGKVTFAWKNYRKDGRQETMTLEADEFIRRFLLHVLPSGFVRIRYYGLLANCHRAKKLQRCRELLNVPQPPCDKPEKQDWTEVLFTLTGQDPLQCPKCERGRMVCVKTMEPPSYPCSRSPPGPASR